MSHRHITRHWAEDSGSREVLSAPGAHRKEGLLAAGARTNSGMTWLFSGSLSHERGVSRREVLPEQRHDGSGTGTSIAHGGARAGLSIK